MLTIMHGYGATSCTESVQHHARFFVQDNGSPTCTGAVQGTGLRHARLQCNTGLPTYGTTEPVMHYVQDGRNPYRTFRRLALTYRTTNATTDRTRERKAS